LSDSESAKEYLQKILDIMPCNQEALTRLGTTYLAEKEWGSAADVYRQLIDLSSEENESIHFLCTLARIAEEGFKDLEVAATSYRRALELVPGEEMIIDKLYEIYQKQNNPIELASFLEQQAKFAFSRKEWNLATKLFNKSAEIFQNCGQLSKAAESYNQVIELNPNDNTARVHLAVLLAQSSTTKLVAINEFRKILQRNPFHIEAYQALFHLYADTKQLDAMMCVGHILSFLGALSSNENESFLEAKSRVPKETFEVLAETEIDALLQHPHAKHPFSWAIRIFGDQLQKIHPPRLSDYGAGRADKLKADHPVFRMAKGLCSVFGLKQIDVYEGSMETSIILENTEPWSMIIGKGLAHKFNIREQRYLLARSAFHLFSKTPLALRLSYEELEDLFGDLVRMVEPDFSRLGRPNEDTIRRLKKTISSKIAKQWETLVPQLIQLSSFDIKAWLQSIYYSADRAALLLCGDITTALEMRLHEGFFDAPQNQTTDQFVSEIRKRPDLAELLSFILSDEHLQLRRRLGLALMENTIE
jgi:tetratricopeptide (TPR) repeat protein